MDREHVLSLAEERLEDVNGTLLTVVQHPFRLPIFFQVVYLVPTEVKISKYYPFSLDDLFTFYELDMWMTSFISGLPWSIWAVQPESVVDVLYRDPQFGELAEHACECINVRFFEPDRYINQELLSVLDLVEMAPDPHEASKKLQWVLLEIGAAIHFARTGDVETNHDVLKRHFGTNGENLLEFDNEIKDWPEKCRVRINDLAMELRGAVACSNINWDIDLALLQELGQLAMGLRTLA